MDSPIEAPNHRLSKDSVKIWMISETLQSVVVLLLMGILLYLDYRLSWVGWVGWILVALTLLFLLLSVWSIFFRPQILYTHWRYEVTEQFLQLKSGSITEVNELVPMTKIQSVATKQGPLLRKYGMYSVSVKTMGSSHTIPILPEEVALELRNQIAHYAKIKEVDE